MHKSTIIKFIALQTTAILSLFLMPIGAAGWAIYPALQKVASIAI